MDDDLLARLRQRASMYRMKLRSACALLVLGMGAAGPLAAQEVRDLGGQLARDGVTAPPPEGFPPLEQLQGRPTPGVRVYASRAGTREITIMVLDPFSLWGGDDVAIRRDHLESMERALVAGARVEAQVQVQDDETHLIKAARLPPGPAGGGIIRVYVARTGSPRAVGIRVTDSAPGADPAANPALVGFLDAARPPVDDGRSAEARTFRQAGVELALPAGVVQPIELSPETTPEHRVFVSHSGSRHLAVIVYDSQERGAADWPADRRARHLRRHGDTWVRELGGRAEEQATEANGFLYRDFTFSRMNRGEVAGRGRLYIPLSGLPLFVMVMYYEDGATQLDEDETTALLDTLRVAPEEGEPR